MDNVTGHVIVPEARYSHVLFDEDPEAIEEIDAEMGTINLGSRAKRSSKRVN